MGEEILHETSMKFSLRKQYKLVSDKYLLSTGAFYVFSTINNIKLQKRPCCLCCYFSQENSETNKWPHWSQSYPEWTEWGHLAPHRVTVPSSLHHALTHPCTLRPSLTKCRQQANSTFSHTFCFCSPRFLETHEIKLLKWCSKEWMPSKPPWPEFLFDSGAAVK